MSEPTYEPEPNDEPEDELNEEQQVAEDVKAELQSIKATVEKERDTSKTPRKASLISSIIEFRPYIDDLPTTNKLKKMKVVALEELLADCIAYTTGLQKQQTNEPDEVYEDAPTQPLPRPTSGAEALYLANVGLASIVEQISKQTSDYTGVEVEGWSDDLKADKDTLVQLLEGVYREHADVCQAYLSPTSVYLLYIMSSGASHLKQKKKPTEL